MSPSRLPLLLLNMAVAAAAPSGSTSAVMERINKLKAWCLQLPGRWWDGEQASPETCPEMAPHYKCG